MITLEHYKNIKEKYGDVASWAVWAEEIDTLKSNMGNMDVFILQKNPQLLDILKPNIIMIGLNFSREFVADVPFKNFHDKNPNANDFKIRYAFRQTEYYGAYMTDIIKKYEMLDSNDVKVYLKNNPDVIQSNVEIFREELSDLRSDQPVILAFGTYTYELIKKYLEKSEYYKLIKLTHYSHYISKENYKKEVSNQINKAFQ